MIASTRTFVGRERELAELSLALDEACAGAGSVWLVGGEAGIGKSRLVEEVARAAAARGAWLLDGRCWEAGGAPAFWPWVQALRGLTRELGAAAVAELLGARAEALAPLLPELAPGGAAWAAGAQDAEQARFQVLEAAAGLLLEASRRAPLVVTLEDLHAADASSLVLLDFVAREVPRARIVVLGTYRDPDLESGPAAPFLARVARAARQIHLRRLDDGEVQALLERVAGTALPAQLAAAVRVATEGNPLFAVEMARLVASDPTRAAGWLGQGGIPLPATIRATFRDRIAHLDGEARELLQIAAVLGRDFTTAAVAEVVVRDEVEVAAPLARAAEAGLVTRLAPESYRFTHILAREVLHDELAPERRWQFHARRAEALTRASEGGGEPPWSEIAHHWTWAGPEGRRHAVPAQLRAAEQATARLAFEDAALALERALSCAEAAALDEPVRRVELRLALARARNLAGDSVAARSACSVVLEHARRERDGELFARAALEFGSGYVYGGVDGQLVELLAEGLAILPPEDGALRARLLARHAAAQQPARQPEEPLELARAAVAMARRVGEPHALLLALRDAGSAFMDSGPVEERIALSSEHVALAERLGESVDAWRGSMRLVFDHFERDDVARAKLAIETATRHAERLGHPHYRWPVVGFRAMAAVREGRFAVARQLLDEARALARSARDPNGERSLLIHELLRLRLEGRWSEERARIGELVERFRGLTSGELISKLWAYAVVPEGEPEAPLADADLERAIALRDSSELALLVAVAERRRDAALAERIAESFTHRTDANVRWGLFGVMVEGPVRQYLARLAVLRGRFDDAYAHFDEALRRARATNARPYVAWTEHDLARALLADPAGGAAARDRAATLARHALDEALALDMPGLVERANEVLVSAGAAATAAANVAGENVGVVAREPGAPRFTLAREGELWSIEHGARRFHVADTKGLKILAALVERPGHDWHVLDLVSPQGARTTEQGDVGELLDARARAEYRERLAALREELEEAESWNDAPRAERARAELELLTEELGRALGPRGRARRTGSDAERARVNVQRRVRDAIRRIGDNDPELARHLTRSIRTGTVCRYEPE